MVIGLRFSKTDQKGRGTKVHIGATSTDICPVVALRNYMVVRPARQGPVFVRVDGSPLLKSTFVQLVRKALLHSGVGQASFSGHSFRIGAATVAAEAGVPVHLLKAMGRWNSDAYLAYVRTSPETLVSLAPKM
uniref:Tyr recombinase domain-containing protein n=1 Tax=Amphimedon queenslandica TaxID=400682 RepID=A0A1X7TCF9_AMPQE